MTVKLRAVSTTPFRSWEDWHGQNEDGENFVVTFETMKFSLYASWQRQAVSYRGESELEETEDGLYRLKGDSDRAVNHDDFDSDEVREPGVYEDKGENCYTVVLPRGFMAFELCQEWVQRLNDEFGTDFELVDPEEETFPEFLEDSSGKDAVGENQ